jgi:hypothetical protein
MNKQELIGALTHHQTATRSILDQPITEELKGKMLQPSPYIPTKQNTQWNKWVDWLLDYVPPQ